MSGLPHAQDKTEGASRRSRGEGSITQLPDGRFQARIDLGWVDGRRKRKAIYGKTREEVARKLTVAMADVLKGVPVLDERQTVEQFLKRWLEDSAVHTLRPRTYLRYEQLVGLHASPHIGKVRLAKLTPQHLPKL